MRGCLDVVEDFPICKEVGEGGTIKEDPIGIDDRTGQRCCSI